MQILFTNYENGQTTYSKNLANAFNREDKLKDLPGNCNKILSF